MEVRAIVQETGIKTIPKKKKCKQAKWLSETQLWKEEKWKAMEKRKDISIWMQSSKEYAGKKATELDMEQQTGSK